MKLKFIISKEDDFGYAKAFNFSPEALKNLEKQYETCLEFLEKTKKLYQKTWNEINEEFSQYIENTTGYKWFYPKYECVISFVHIGLSNWGTMPQIVRYWKENPYYMRKITAHELILSHYFEIIKREYSNENLTDGQIWALAEIAAYALTSLTPEVKKWWPWDTEYKLNHTYQNIVPLQIELKEIFLKRKTFDEYIKKGIEIVKKYPEMGPPGWKR